MSSSEDTYASFDAAQAAANSCGGYPVYYNGSYRVRIGSYRSADDVPAGQGTVVSGGARSVLVVKAGTEQILFGFDCGSTRSLSLAPQNGSGAAITQVAECKERNGSRSCTYYGDFQFTRLSTQEPQKLTLVNFVGLEPYVKGVTPYEMSSGWPLEALKAQAVCARTYVASHMNGSPAYGFDVTGTTTSQVYYGTLDASANSDRAVDETAGKFVRYEGKLCETFYFAADGGATEDSENVWVTKVPYLRGVVEPYEKDIEFYCKSWSTTISRAAVGDVSITYTPIGNAMTVTVGGKTYSKDAVRTFLTSVCGQTDNLFIGFAVFLRHGLGPPLTHAAVVAIAAADDRISGFARASGAPARPPQHRRCGRGAAAARPWRRQVGVPDPAGPQDPARHCALVWRRGTHRYGRRCDRRRQQDRTVSL